mgnify:FL=1
MTVSVNEEQLIGTFIPDVYIETITLETAGTEIRENNPHIDHVRESIKSNQPADNSLLVTIDLGLKEQLGNDLIGTWFSNQDFQKYLKLLVIQSTDPLVTKLMSAANNAIQLANINSQEEAAVFTAELMDELKNLPEFKAFGNVPAAYSIEDIPDILELIFKNTQSKFISVKDYMQDSETMLTQQEYFVTDTGARVYNFSFRLSFDIPTRTPNHLTYFAVSSIDIDQIIQDFNLDKTDTTLLELMNGKVAIDNVISNGGLVAKAFVFTDENGQTWTGPVHKQGGTFLTGTPESTYKKPVTRSEVQNSKIQDFRNYDDLERLQLNFSVIENTRFNANLPITFLNNDNMDVVRSASYFSEVGLSRDSKGACRFIFAMDYGKLIKEKTRFGALYNKNNLQEMFSNVRIRNFNVVRRRVERDTTGYNQLGSPAQRTRLFGDASEKEVIAYSGEKTPGKMSSVNRVNGVFREIALDFDADYTEVRHFTGVDQSMPAVTDGLYQYGVEIEVEDNSVRLILDKIKQLSVAKYRLDYYYNLCTLPKNYDMLRNRFTESFIEEMYSQYGWSKDKKALINSPWILPVITYFSVLSFFRKDPVDVALAGSMWKYLDPKRGNPRGVAMVQKLVENLAQRLASAIGVNLSPKKSSTFKPGGTMPANILSPGKPALKTFKIEYYFPQIFDSNIPKSYGYDYLSRNLLEVESADDGLRILSGEEYRKRTEIESLKFFNTLDGDISINLSNNTSFTPGDNLSNSSFTYLSPSNVNLSNRGNFSLIEKPFDYTKTMKIQSAILALNLAKKSPFSPVFTGLVEDSNSSNIVSPDKLDIKSNLINTMSEFNCSMLLPVASPFQNILQLLDFDYDPYVNASDSMGLSYNSIDNETKPSVESKSKNEFLTHINPSMLFANLAFPMIMSGKGMSGIYTNVNVIPPVNFAKKTQIIHTFNPAYYNLGNISSTSTSLIQDNFLSNFTAIDVAQPLDLDQNIIDQNMINSALALPNQIKSLLLSSVANSPIKYNWLQSTTLPAPNKAAFILNYKSIRKIEALVGYEVDSDGQPMLKSPIWKPLTPEIVNAAGENNLLCRSVRYVNEDAGCHEAVGMRLPVYNKYFIIGGPAPKSSPMLRIGKRLYRDKLSRRINRNLRQHQFIRSEYLSTAVMATRKIIPKPATKQMVKEKVDLTKKISTESKVN